uniref:SWIM-type domain-containing protein n=1 Tax=Solanum lycopersicum TaxID=4081 RepID=A0A3Q7JXJ2_SOLLC
MEEKKLKFYTFTLYHDRDDIKFAQSINFDEICIVIKMIEVTMYFHHHDECGTTYDNSEVDYSTIALYFKDKLQSDLTYKAMKLGFKSGLRPMIGLDGTLLKEKAKGQVFNNSFYPLAWGVIDKETNRTCTWFMQHFLELQNNERLKFISDMQKISKVCKVSGNGDNGYEVTEGADKHIVNLKEKKCTCRTWDLNGIPCPYAIKVMEHKKMIPKKEIHWYYSKEAALAVHKHKLQPVRGEPFWKCNLLHTIEPQKLVKLVGGPKLMREREKNEVVNRQGVWKQTRKRKVMTCSSCGEQNHNARGCEKAKQGKEPTKNINYKAPQPTQESQLEYVSSSIYFPVAKDDDEDPRLSPRSISKKTFLSRLRKRQNPQEPIESRVTGFRGDKFSVSEPTNIPIAPTDLNLKWTGCSYYKSATDVEAKKGLMLLLGVSSKTNYCFAYI